jgi:magnesium-transporting ATPase (P-type)|mmetsp:Transcript_11514/g.15539  ORF Transcript_11514/g.15539 Transcript_11514/m.15539 type:complete len:258 (+) Transcript_11514:1253-2026(+)
MLIDYLAKVHPGRASSTSPTGFGSESFRTAPPVATVGVVGSGQNDILMMNKAKISFSTYNQVDDIARNAADMILRSDNISDVVNAVVRGRAFKDRLMMFLMLQIPASICSVALVFLQVFLYDQILVTASYIFLINMIYFPFAIACLVREDPGSRRYEMIERWRSGSYPGTKSITSYMRAELIKFSILVVAIFQISALAGLYYYADSLFELVHTKLNWQEHKNEPLFVNQEWLTTHPNATDVEIKDLTDKGMMFLILF